MTDSFIQQTQITNYDYMSFIGLTVINHEYISLKSGTNL